MDVVIQEGYSLRSKILEDAMEIITKFVECLKEGFICYEEENDFGHSLLRPGDMVLWPDLHLALRS